jgi:tRNA nucleotidyltransferase/poly(A) polymerase
MELAPIESLRSDRLAVEVWHEMGRPSCFVAGGYLRDRLLGRPSTDLDFTVVGTIESAAGPARRLARARGTRAHLLGRAPHAVWRVDSAGLKVELWPLCPLTLDDDIQRRDFSCNALVWEMPEGPLIDRVGGLDDLRAGRLRAVSRVNLEDDPLRLLRASRFLAQLECLELDERTASSIRELAPELARAPRARVGSELRLLLDCRGAERGLRSLLELDTFRCAAPAGSSPEPVWIEAHAAAFGRLAGSRRHPVPAAVAAAGPAAALALLLRGWGCPDEPSTAEYCWPRTLRQASRRAAELLEAALAAADGGPAERRELIHAAGGHFPVLLAAAAAVDGGDPGAHARWRRWWSQWRRHGGWLTTPPPLLTAAEVAARSGLGPGPDLGRLLRGLQLAQVRGEVRTAAGARGWVSGAARVAAAADDHGDGS